MNLREISREASFLRGYLKYIRYENPLFPELQKKYERYSEILLEARRENPYFDADWRGERLAELEKEE